MAPIVVYFSLVLARVGAFVAILPLMGGTQMPRLVKVGLTMALTYLWGTTYLEQMPLSAWLGQPDALSWIGFTVAVGRDALLGAVVGYTFGLFLIPARIAGDFLAQEMGFSFGNLVSAVGSGSATPLTSIFEMLAAAIFFGLDGHHVFLGVMHATFLQYPVGGGLTSVPLERLINGTIATQEWALMLAAPVAMCLFLITAVLTLLARANPQLNLYSVGFPLRLGVGLVAMLLFLPHLVATLTTIYGHFGDLATRML